MNPTRHGTTLQQRLEIWQRAQAGQTDPVIARAMSLPVMTVRKWRRKAQHSGREGLASILGRPPTGALSHTSASVRDTIRRLRHDHPGWGPQTLRCELERLGQSCVPLPHRSCMAAFLHQEGLCRRYQHRSELPQSLRSVPTTPHELWQLDAQGAVRVPTLGRVALINIVDAVTHAQPASYPALGSGKPSTPEYQLALRCAFLHLGLPQAVSLDHDTVFHDTRSSSPYPTLIHLWLLALGIAVHFTRKHCPTDHASVERCHQTMESQTLTGQTYGERGTLWAALGERLDVLNNTYPSRALGGRAPLQAYPEARHSQRWYRPEWEEQMLDLQRVDAYLGTGRWFRWVDKQGQFYLGDHRYGLGRTWANQQIEVTFGAQTREFVCRSADGQRTACLPAQGLTKSALLGELSPLMAVPYYQPMLAYDPVMWRQQVLGQLLSGTTL